MQTTMNSQHYEFKAENYITALYKSNKGNKPIERFHENIVNFNQDLAYAIQSIIVDKKINERDEQIKGYKINMTSEDIQKYYKSESPIYGTLTTSNMSNGILMFDNLMEPQLETGLIFIIDEDLSLKVDKSEILAKTSVAPGIEATESRFKNWFPNLSLGEMIADNCIAGKIAMGDAVKSFSLKSFDNIAVQLYFDAENLANGHSSEVLGNPLNSIMWLVKKLNANGKTLKKGMVVSSGTFTKPKALYKGTYKAVFEGIGEISLKVR